MALITLYPAETQNFAGNGLLEIGRYCTRCDLSEELNGPYSADIEFCVFDKMDQIRQDMVLRLPANVRPTPYMEIAGTPPAPERTIYRVHVTTSSERTFTYVYSKARWDYQYAIKRVHAGTEYEYQGKKGDYFHRAVLSDGTSGYILNGDGEFVRNEGGEGTLPHTIESHQTRDQLFRIKRVTPGTNGVTVFARHISADLQRDNYVPEIEAKDASGAQLAQAVFDACAIEHPFNVFSDVGGAYTGKIGRTDPISALIDEDTGLTALLGGEILRDNFDIYYANSIGMDRGASIEYGKNAVSMQITEDEDDVCTRVIPVGYDKDGNAVMLPETYVDSPRAAAWDRPRGVRELDLRDVKIGDEIKTKDALYKEMRRSAQEYFETGVDQVQVSAEAEYVDLSRTDAAGRGPVSIVFLGDTVLLRDPRHKKSYKAKVTSYVFDALTGTYRTLGFGQAVPTLGNIKWAAKNIANGTISAQKLAAQSVTGQVIAKGAVTGGNLGDGAVVARAIAADAVTADKIAAGAVAARHIETGTITADKMAAGALSADLIAAGSITADKLAAGAVTADKLAAGAVTADSITSGKLDTDRLIVGGTEFSIVRALNRLADSLSENDDRIEGGVLEDKSISAVKVTDDFGAGLELSSNAAVLLLAGKLDGTHSHMELTEDAINMVGGDINIATDDLDVRGMQDGEQIMSLDPDGLSADRVVVLKEFSAPNAVLKNLSPTIPWKGGIQASLDAAPKWLTEDVTLEVPAGTYQEEVEIRGFYGSCLKILFQPGATLAGHLNVRNCTHVILTAASAGDGFIYPLEGGAGTVNFYAVTRAEVSNMYISGYRGRTNADDGSDIALYFNSCHALVRGCCLEYANKGLSCNYSVVFAEDNFGGKKGTDPTTNANLKTGIYASSGSHVFLVGDYPMGGEDDYKTYCGVLSTFSLGSAVAGGMDYYSPNAITKSFSISKHCTYLYGVQRQRDDQSTQLSQGHYGGFTADGLNWRTGAMWFKSATDALEGRQIVSARLRLRRASGGNNTTASAVYLGYVPLTQSDYNTTLTPSFTKSKDNYPGAALMRYDEAEYDVTELMGAVQQGYALAVREPTKNYGEGAKNCSAAYAVFYGKGSSYEPVLTVTYKGEGSDEGGDSGGDDTGGGEADETLVTLTGACCFYRGDSTPTSINRSSAAIGLSANGNQGGIIYFDITDIDPTKISADKSADLKFVLTASTWASEVIMNEPENKIVPYVANGQSNAIKFSSYKSLAFDLTPTFDGANGTVSMTGADLAGYVENQYSVPDVGTKRYIAWAIACEWNNPYLYDTTNPPTLSFYYRNYSPVEPDTPTQNVAFVANADGSVALTGAAFAQLSDGSVQLDNATFTAQDDGSVLIQ